MASGGMPPPFVLKPGRNITDAEGDKWQAVGILEGKMDDAVEWFRSKMMGGPELARAPNGYYTFIIKCGALVVMPVLSNQEVGSVHVNMWSWTPHCDPTTPTPNDVTAAGEIKKIGNKINFNLKSGTFMQRLFTAAARKGQDTKTVASKIATEVTANINRFEPLEAIFLKCDPCTADYETVSGQSILDRMDVNIVTSEKEMFWLRQFFILQDRTPKLKEEEKNAALGTLVNSFGSVKIGGAQKRYRRKQRNGRSRALRYKTAARYTRRKRSRTHI